MRMKRLTSLQQSTYITGPAAGGFLQTELDTTTKRLTEAGTILNTKTKIDKRWATHLYKAVDGGSLKDSAQVSH